MMDQRIEEAIAAVLGPGGPDRIRQAAGAHLGLPDALMEALRKDGANVRGPFPTRPWPSSRWLVVHTPLISGPRDARFQTDIQISKIVPAFLIVHSFEIPFRHPEAVSPRLSGESWQAFTRSQFALHEEVVRVLASEGLTEVTLGDAMRCRPVGSAKVVNPLDGLVSIERLLFADCLEALEPDGCPTE